MIYPTIRAYVDALNTPKASFRTLKNITLELDKNEEPIFQAKSKYTNFNIKIRGKEAILKAFTHDQKEIKLNEDATLFKKELLVAVGDELHYFDIVLQGRHDTPDPKTSPCSEVHEDRVAFMENNKWGFKNSATEVVITPKYDSVGEFVEGRTTVIVGGYYGLIDREGKEVIEPKYDDLSYDNSHLCYVDNEGLMGVIDRTGREVVKCEWDFIGEFSHGLLLVQKGQKYGYVNDKGEIAIVPKYDDANSFDHNGYAKVSLESESFIIDIEEYRV